MQSLHKNENLLFKDFQDFLSEASIFPKNEFPFTSVRLAMSLLMKIRSCARKGNGALVMASVRNLAISLLRMAGARYIAPALRACSRLDLGVLRFIGLAVRL